MKKSILGKHATTLALAVVVSFAAALSAQAQLAYEGFDYGDGVWLGNTNAGGYGWGASWYTGGQNVATNYNGSLSYSDGTYSLVTSGGHAVIGSYAPQSGTQQLQRNLAANLTNLLGGGGTIWMSFLYQNWTTDSAGRAGFRQAQMMMTKTATTNANGTSNNNGTETVDVGSGNTYLNGVPADKISLWGASPVGQPYAQQSSLTTPRGSSTDPVFILMRFDLGTSTAADTVYVWVDPTLGSEPLTSTAISTNVWDLGALNGIRFAAGNQNTGGTNAVYAFDEIRVGLDFRSVAPIPEPAIFGLVAIGGLGLLALRRRRQ